MRIILLLILSLCSVSIFAQKEAETWYFADRCGIDFSSGSAVAILSGNMAAQEGCATMSSKTTGKILFYTDGEKVWNRNHAIMPNGAGLLGYVSATQNSVIVPNPCDTNIYYIFTSDGITYDPLTQRNNFPNDSVFCYHTVDMSMDGGLGDLSMKNTVLFSPVNETVAAVKHSNGIDTWVVAHEFLTSDYFSYLVTASGVSGPIVSSPGGVAQAGFPVSHLKFSPDGSKLAFGSADMRIYDFNSSTGLVTNRMNLGAGTGAYGFSFSPNSKLLYVSEGQFRLTQYDISSGVLATIIASKDTIYEHTWNNYFGWNIQNAPDGKMYVAKTNSYKDSLGVINNPNAKGAACNYDNIGFYLGGRDGDHSFPNFIESYFDSAYATQALQGFNVKITGDTIICTGDNFTIDVNGPNGATYLWNNGNMTNSISGSLTQDSIFYVTVTYNGCIATDTQLVTVNSPPIINFTGDTVICEGDQANITASGGTLYAWNTGDSTVSITVSPLATTTYRVVVDSPGCSAVDSIQVVVESGQAQITAYTGPYCSGAEVNLIGNPSGALYEWSTGDTSMDLSLILEEANSFWLKVTLGNCIAYDTIDLTVYAMDSLSVSNDTIISEGESATLIAKGNGNFSWSPTSSLSCDSCPTTIATPEESTFYYVDMLDSNGCLLSDSIFVEIEDPCSKGAIFIPNAFTPNGDGNNDLFSVYGAVSDQFEMLVYDRWGKQVFKSNDQKDGWDGRLNGKEASPGVYVYYLKVSCPDGYSFERQGNVTLLK